MKSLPNIASTRVPIPVGYVAIETCSKQPMTILILATFVAQALSRRLASRLADAHTASQQLRTTLAEKENEVQSLDLQIRQFHDAVGAPAPTE